MGWLRVEGDEEISHTSRCDRNSNVRYWGSEPGRVRAERKGGESSGEKELLRIFLSSKVVQAVSNDSLSPLPSRCLHTFSLSFSFDNLVKQWGRYSCPHLVVWRSQRLAQGHGGTLGPSSDALAHARWTPTWVQYEVTGTVSLSPQDGGAPPPPGHGETVGVLTKERPGSPWPFSLKINSAWVSWF